MRNFKGGADSLNNSPCNRIGRHAVLVFSFQLEFSSPKSGQLCLHTKQLFGYSGWAYIHNLLACPCFCRQVVGRVLIVFGICLREPVFLLKGSSILEFRCLAAATVDPDFPDSSAQLSRAYIWMALMLPQFLAKEMMFIIFRFVLRSTQHVMRYAKKDVTACSYTTHHASFCQFLRH
jgi:hypothetical protein